MKIKLTDDQKRLIEREVFVEVADMLLSDDGDPFKHRSIPEEIFDGDLPDATIDKLSDLADDYFFVCVEKIAGELKARSRK